jgi:hypothetical protein
VEWSVSGSERIEESGERLRWRLPAEPGLYQVEVAVDYGDEGIALDAMTFEVA